MAIVQAGQEFSFWTKNGPLTHCGSLKNVANFFHNFYPYFPDACHNKECPFLHIDPESKIRDCPWYDRGFCRHGPSCRHRHVRRILCLNYLAGFCPKGPECADTHPKFELPPIGGPDDPRGTGKKIVITCHYCGEPGHKVSHCTKVPPEIREQHAQVSKIGSLKKLGRKIDEMNLCKKFVKLSRRIAI